MRIRIPNFVWILCLAHPPLHADWRDEIGFTRLQLLAAAELPAAPSRGLTHTEAPIDSNYAPDTTSSAFIGKSFALKSGDTGTSWHATAVATNFYGSTSLIPGATPVDVYEADHWIGSGFLNLETSNPPGYETRAVQNHSWIGSLPTETEATEANLRLDFAINRDGFVCVVGENNGNSTTLPQLLGQGYHTISVGLTNGAHSAGFTTFDVPGRIKPDIVAPDTLTSYASPMVASTAGLLVATLEAPPYALAFADRPRVVKALLLAAASKTTVASWSNTSSQPLDLRYGAGELNAWNAYATLRSGQAPASNSIERGPCGWAAEAVSSNSTNTYFFNIPAGAPATPFSAALTWHRKMTDNRGVWRATMANLNLHLYQASGFTLGTLVAESLSAVDNVELVYQTGLPPGDYALVVNNNSASITSYGLAWHSLPAVTVAATTPIARELDGQAGLVTFTRTGDTSLALYVPLDVGGTATPGADYQALPASVTIAAGLTTTTLAITPVSDQLAQGERTVTVAVAADFALVRDPAQAALVTIQDQPFDAWRFAHFSSIDLGDTAISGETADPDGDQIPNLVEYALGLAPKLFDPMPVAMIDVDGYLALSAGKATAATDITWAAESSADLTTWDPAVIILNTSSNFEARDSVPVSAASRRFIRLKITRP